MLKLVVDNTRKQWKPKAKRVPPPEQHCLFMQQDIACLFFDDFMVLPAAHIVGNVYEGMPDAVQRHSDYWRHTH